MGTGSTATQHVDLHTLRLKLRGHQKELKKQQQGSAALQSQLASNYTFTTYTPPPMATEAQFTQLSKQIQGLNKQLQALGTSLTNDLTGIYSQLATINSTLMYHGQVLAGLTQFVEATLNWESNNTASNPFTGNWNWYTWTW